MNPSEFQTVIGLICFALIAHTLLALYLVWLVDKKLARLNQMEQERHADLWKYIQDCETVRTRHMAAMNGAGIW